MSISLPRRLAGSAVVVCLALGACVVTALPPASAATPIPAGSVSGAVYASDGAPVANALVTLYRYDAADDLYVDVAEASTGVYGEYLVAHVAPGTYKASFEADGFVGEFYNDASDPDTAASFTVGSGFTPAPSVTLAVEPPSVVVDADTDATGIVTDAATGKPIYGIRVGAYDATTGAPVDSALTDSVGRYAMDELGGHPAVKLLFSDWSADGADLAYLDSWNGGTRLQSTAASVTLTPGTPVTVSTALTRSAGISGSTINPSGVAPFDGDVVVYDADTDIVGSANVRDDGSFFVGGLNPGESYKVRVTGAYDYPGNDGDAAPHVYFDTWHADGGDFTSATAVIVGASGTWTSATAIRLRDSLVALVAPRVTGSWLVKGTLTANRGRWNRNAGSTFTYEWLRDSTVVGTGSTYRPVAADAGRRIAVRVTNATVFDYEQRVATATSSAMVVKYAGDAEPRVTWVRKGQRRVARVVFRVSTDGREPAAMVTGTINVLKRGVRVATLKVREGRATFLVSKPGNHSFTYTYGGNRTTTGSRGGFHVRVK